MRDEELGEPRFSLNTKVFDLKARKWGKVVNVFKGWYGWGYYITHSGYTWSLPEESLTANKKLGSHLLGTKLQNRPIRGDN